MSIRLLTSSTTVPVDKDIYTVGDNTGGIVIDSIGFVYLVTNSGYAISYLANYGNEAPATLYSANYDFKQLALNNTEDKLYIADQQTGYIYYYDFINETGEITPAVGVSYAILLQSITFDIENNLYFNRVDNKSVYKYRIQDDLTVHVAGGGTLTYTPVDPLTFVLGEPTVLLADFSNNLYIASITSGSTTLYKITFKYNPRANIIAPPPQQRRYVCGIASPGNCKRALVPFNPREYWGWGSPNRKFLTPDPNVSCVPSLVYQLCPTIPNVVEPPPVPPEPPIPTPPAVPTELATTQFTTRLSSTGIPATISDATSTVVANTGLALGSPGLGPLGEIYMTTAQGYLYKYDGSGNAAWATYLADTLVNTSPSVATTGAITVATDNGRLININNADGSIIWQSNLPGQFTGSPASYTNSNATIDTIIAAYGGNITSFNATNGAIAWQNTIPSGTFANSVYISGANVYAGSTRGIMYSYERTSGNIRWVYNTGTNQSIYSTGNLATKDNLLFFGCTSNLYAINTQVPRITSKDWTRTLPGPIKSSPALYLNGITQWAYVITETTNCLYGVTQAGIQWTSAETNLDPDSSPTIDSDPAGPFVYATSTDGYVYKYNAVDSGTQSSISTLDISDRRIFSKCPVIASQGKMYVLANASDYLVNPNVTTYLYTIS
jgi:outer membrane protein assembly factor BamB